jgi:glycosyltransferase involved in cell wall biosynthesis
LYENTQLPVENFLLPKITIVTPSYNQGHYLEVCIRSVLDQNYPNLEYIIIDGGSTDNSPDIIQRYQSHLAYWVSEPDGGQSEAINKGLQRATGELVAWLNSDDFYLPNAFRHVAQVYQATAKAPFYFGDGVRVNEHGEILRPFFPKGSHFFSGEALRYGLNYILQPATFIHRESLQTSGYLSPTLHYGLDTDLWLRLATLGHPCPIPAPLAASREYGATKTASGSFVRIEELRQIAQAHTSIAITPGVICYLLDTLYHFAQEHPDLFPAHYQRHILRFWGETSLIMDRFGARPDGFPLPSSETNSKFHYLRRAWWVHLRNFIKGYPTLARRLLGK